MSGKITSRGPWGHRVAVLFFSVLAGTLLFWLLGFAVDDIGEMRGPQYGEVEKRHLDPGLLQRLSDLDRQIADTHQRINDQKSRQSLLRDSTNSSQQTMQQLLEMQRLNIQRNVKPSEAEQNALAESEKLFLANQKQYQGLNEDTVRSTEEERHLQQQKKETESLLDPQRAAAQHEFSRQAERHHLKIAFFQLLFLIPLLLIAVYLYIRRRSSLYASLIHAFGIAILAKVTLVIHEHFPSRYFKYILLLVALAVVVRVLVYLIRVIAFPRLDWLIKQYREAYERFFCPVCEYPIRRGPMKYRFWDRRSLRKLPPAEPTGPSPDEPYVCPSCGTRLFEKCSSCSAIRYSLLPFCEQCGAEKDLAAGSAGVSRASQGDGGSS